MHFGLFFVILKSEISLFFSIFVFYKKRLTVWESVLSSYNLTQDFNFVPYSLFPSMISTLFFFYRLESAQFISLVLSVYDEGPFWKMLVKHRGPP